MSNQPYNPGPAAAKVRKDSSESATTWTLVLVRDLAHPPAKVWKALTDPKELQAWAPFDADRDLGTAGATAKLTTVGAPGSYVSETTIKRAEAPKLLEFDWGGGTTRWELEPQGNGGTRLTLWANIDRRYIAMGAAGWHVCLDVLDRFLGGTPIPRIVGPPAMQFAGWQRLHAEYAKLFGAQK